jgi:hypothetical protein
MRRMKVAVIAGAQSANAKYCILSMGGSRQVTWRQSAGTGYEYVGVGVSGRVCLRRLMDVVGRGSFLEENANATMETVLGITSDDDDDSFVVVATRTTRQTRPTGGGGSE